MRTSLALAVLAPLLLTHGGPAAAATPLGPSFAPKGEVRLATLTASNPVTTNATFNTGFVPIPGLGVPITIPRGKVADVTVLFTGEINSADATFVSAVVDGAPASPGVVQAFWGVGGGATSQAANFTTVLGEGTHSIQMQWGGLGGQQFVSLRSMVVIVNLRRQMRAS